MGEHAIRRAADTAEERSFTRSVVRDLRALEELITRGGIESGITRMGAEQEMYLVGPDCRPAPIAEKVLPRIGDDRFTTELARFNLEANFEPRRLAGSFLERLQADLEDALRVASNAAGDLGARVLLTGILPTLRAEDLGIKSLSPDPRYQYLNEALFHGRHTITVVIDGIDQYAGSYDSVALEGANTSLQLHLQVEPAESANLYNLMQLITAPLLAAATNSPVLLGRRLWHETRIAVFERAFDERTAAKLARGFPARVPFGNFWVKESIVEIFHDNVARFPVILTCDLDEDSLATIAENKVPQLAALSLHNGTVWRWNRPCYGVTDGVAHLRIENRVLPAGPTVVDEVANAALFYGMMSALPSTYGNVVERVLFKDAKFNFLSAARLGLAAEFNWLDGRVIGARTLLLDELIPAAREGLASLNVPVGQIERYLGIVKARVESGQSGSNWLLNTFQAQRDREPSEVWRDAVDTMMKEQMSGRPVHEWKLALGAEGSAMSEPTVATIMTTDLFTLRPDDVVDLAIGVMEWKHIRHIPVEGDNGELLGVLTARDLLRASQAHANETISGDAGAARTLMRTDFIQVDPETSLKDALSGMLKSDLGCLMVVSDGRLMGIVTERDLVRAASEVIASGAT